MIRSLFSILIILFVSGSKLVAQDTTKLKVGDKAPGLILSNAVNGVQSFGFPYNNKIVFLYFWSSSVARSKIDHYKYSRIYSKYWGLDYKSCDGFEMLFVALQSDKIAWQEDLKTYGLNSINNGIALRGFNDFTVKRYNLSQTPTGFLIDETGKIALINPDVKALIGYLNSRKNNINASEVQTRVAGKILFGKEMLSYKNEKLVVLNEKKDTVQQVMTDENGNFFLDKLNSGQNYVISILASKQTANPDKFYISNQMGGILSLFTKKEKVFEYNLLDVDMPFLKVNKENANPPATKFLQEAPGLNFSENLFRTSGTQLSKESTLVLDKVLKTLKQNPKIQLEIITHTDSKGEADINLSLSIKQSVAVLNYFMTKGIDKKRLKALGKGESEPLNKCADGIECSEEELEVNRRTEFRFYKTE